MNKQGKETTCDEFSKTTKKIVLRMPGEAIIMCLEPLCVRLMQFASFTCSFAYSYLSIYLFT
jgi:hypothetical protein